MGQIGPSTLRSAASLVVTRDEQTGFLNLCKMQMLKSVVFRIVKDAIKTIKKRLWHKNAKVQMHTLVLLESIIKNCGDIVHTQVAEKGVLHEMVKIVKKKPDCHVKDKILTLIDTWQKAFGGPNARQLQYYVAYQELLRAGTVFPQRLESSLPRSTPPESQPLQNYGLPMRTFAHESEFGASTVPSQAAELPTLSPAEMKTAREVMKVLSEMLDALDLRNREGLKEAVIVDLVAICRGFKQRAVQLAHITRNEDLLNQVHHHWQPEVQQSLLQKFLTISISSAATTTSAVESKLIC